MAGYTIELSGGIGPGIAILIYGQRFIFRARVQAAELRLETQPLDGGRAVRLFTEYGPPDLRRVFYVIVRWDRLQPVGLRKARMLAGPFFPGKI